MKSLTCLAAVLLIFSGCKKDLQLNDNDLLQQQDAAARAQLAGSTAKPVLGVCYVEVNNHNILNAGAYTLKNSGQQLFDVAIIFAANMNYEPSTKRAILYSNNNVTKVLANSATYVEPLHAKGLKVLLSVLGNHQGIGITNLTSRAAAADFARQVAQTVYTYNLDGVDLDDEFSDYGKNNTGQPNDSSFVMLTEELRAQMPDKIISFYYYGPATSRQSYNGKRVGDFINFSWNANYGTYSVPNVPPLAKSQLGPAATWINNTLAAVATANAVRTAADGYGIYLYYDLHGSNEENYLSGPAFGLYGDSAKMTGTIMPWSQGNAPDAPSLLSASDEQYSSVNVSWQTVAAAESYSIDYKEATSTNWTNFSNSVTGTSATLPNLTPNTTYDWRIKCNSSKGSSVYSFAQFRTTALTGVIFFENAGYTGASTAPIAKGSYTLAQLKTFGFIDNWASSAQVPAGYKVTIYSADRFKKNSWVLTSSTSNFALLSPSADEKISSVKIE